MSVHAYDHYDLPYDLSGVWAEDGQPPRRGLPPHRGALTLMGAVAGALACLLLAGAILAVADAPPSPVPSPVPSSTSNPPPSAAPASPIPSISPWVDIIHPIQLFDLASPEFDKLAFTYAAQRHLRGGGRQDILTYGSLTDRIYLRLQLYRVGTEPAPALPFYVDLARATGAADLAIARSLAPAELLTRFGPFEVADLSLAGSSPAGGTLAGPVPCLGFRGVALAGQFRLSGFVCGSQSMPISRPALACLIDRLDLTEAGDDQALASFFAATELNRNPACAGAALRPTVHRASWLDRNDAPPPLQGKKPL